MSFLFGLLFFVLLFVLVIGGAVLLGIVRIVSGFFGLLFGKNKGKSTSRRAGGRGGRVSSNTEGGSSATSQPRQSSRKIIDSTEGEYVDYEEIE